MKEELGSHSREGEATQRLATAGIVLSSLGWRNKDELDAGTGERLPEGSCSHRGHTASAGDAGQGRGRSGGNTGSGFLLTFFCQCPSLTAFSRDPGAKGSVCECQPRWRGSGVDLIRNRPRTEWVGWASGRRKEPVTTLPHKLAFVPS